jgi:hypothetical protein
MIGYGLEAILFTNAILEKNSRLHLETNASNQPKLKFELQNSLKIIRVVLILQETSVPIVICIVK